MRIEFYPFSSDEKLEKSAHHEINLFCWIWRPLSPVVEKQVVDMCASIFGKFLLPIYATSCWRNEARGYLSLCLYTWNLSYTRDIRHGITIYNFLLMCVAFYGTGEGFSRECNVLHESFMYDTHMPMNKCRPLRCILLFCPNILLLQEWVNVVFVVSFTCTQHYTATYTKRTFSLYIIPKRSPGKREATFFHMLSVLCCFQKHIRASFSLLMFPSTVCYNAQHFSLHTHLLYYSLWIREYKQWSSFSLKRSLPMKKLLLFLPIPSVSGPWHLAGIRVLRPRLKRKHASLLITEKSSFLYTTQVDKCVWWSVSRYKWPPTLHKKNTCTCMKR